MLRQLPSTRRKGAAHWVAPLCVALLVALAGALTLSLRASAQPVAKRLESTEWSFVSAVNRVRAEHGLAELDVDGTLVRAARSHSLDMVARGYFEHGDFASRLAAAGAEGPRVGETLGWAAKGDPVRRIVTKWLESPTHRAVILRPGYRRIGVGVTVGPFKGFPRVVVITADFEGR